MSDKKTNTLSLLSLLMIVIIFAFGYFIINPAVNSFKEVNIAIGAKDKENQELNQKFTTLNKLKTDFSVNEQQLNTLRLAMPNDEQMADFIASIEDIAVSSGVKISSITNNKLQTKTTGEEIKTSSSVAVAFEGSYSGFKLMLEKMQNNIRYIKVNKISLTKNISTTSQENLVTGNMELNLFTVKSVVINNILDSGQNIEGEGL